MDGAGIHGMTVDFAYATFHPGQGARVLFMVDGELHQSSKLTPSEALNITEVLLKFVRDSMQEQGNGG